MAGRMQVDGQRSAKLALLGFSIVLSLFLAECALRLAVDPVDYLEPELQPHEILRWTIEPGSGGHDRWGYRNEEVPESVDIVALGDSQTYGHSATRSSSWPAQLAASSGRSVYNLALGGYGPADYAYLTRTRVPELQPEHLLVGLYTGNDLKDAFRSVYTKEHWSSRREPSVAADYDADYEMSSHDQRVIRGDKAVLALLRRWLGRHSVLYRVVGHSAIGDLIRRVEHADSDRMSRVRISGGHQQTHLTHDRAASVDLSLAEVSQGLELTLGFLSDIVSMARAQDLELSVVMISSKILVYGPAIEAEPGLSEHDNLMAVVHSEQRARQRVSALLRDLGVHQVDPLPELRRAALHGTIVYPSFSWHPNSEGYGVIAVTVAKALELDSEAGDS